MVMRKLQLTWAFTFWSVLNASRVTVGKEGSSLERGEAGHGASGAAVLALPPPTLQEWLDTLTLQHAQARADAANELGNLGKEAAEAIPKLTQLLQDDREVAGDMCVRDAAVRALGHIGSAAASSVPEILKQLRRRSTSSFREPVAFALANIGQEAPEAVLPSVLEALQASEWYVRWVAASACGLLGEKAAAFVPWLRQLAKYDSEEKVRTVASQSLSDMSKVITLPTPNMTDWQLQLDSTSSQARADAANELGNLGKEAAEAIPKLTQLLQDDREVAGDMCVRDAAVRALGHIGSAAASSVPEILKQLRRRSTSSFREPVAFALANVGQEAPEAVLPSVLEALQASEWYVRWVAASACGLLGEKAAAFVPRLRQLAKYDSEPKVRTVASQSLSDMSKVITLPAPKPAEWHEYLDGSSSQARADAANELGKLAKLGKEGAKLVKLGNEAAKAIPKLTQLLQDDRDVAGDMCVRDAAVRALGHMGSAAASSVPEILKQLRRRSTSSFREPVAFALANIGQEAPEAVLPSVLEALQASEWYVRWVAASACGLLGEKAAAFVPRLRQLAKYDSEEKVRTVASQSLSDMSKVITLPTPNMTDWQLQLDSTSSQARADAANELGKWGKQAAEAIPKLTQLLQDDREVAGDMCVRDAAVRALGHIGSAAASSVPEILKQLRRRSTSSFREPVAFALANMGQQAPEAVLPSLLEALQASEWYVRWVAASACGLLGEKAAAFVPRLRQLAKYDSEEKVRTVASQSLSDMSKVITLPMPNMADWQLQLDGTSSQARADAANELGKWGKQAAEAIPKLTQLLQDDREVAGEMCVRDAAVRALGHIGSAAASSVPEILKQLRRRSTSSFREPVAFALASMGQQAPEAVLPSVLEALQASEWYVRWVAASACGLLGEKAAGFVPQLRQLAKYDSEPKVRTVASQSLSDMSKVMTLPMPNMTDWQLQLDGTSSQARADAANELGKWGKQAAEAIPKLTQLLQDDRDVAGDMCVRDAAVRALGHMGSAAASSVPEILKQLRRRSTSSFREPVAFALANIGQEAPEAVLPSVLEALQASEWYVRWVAASACGLLGEKAAAFVPRLRQLAKYDSEEKVRTVASQSLSDMSKVITLPMPNMTDWQLQLDGTSSQARADAANELGKWGKQAAEAIPKLTQLLQDDREVAGDMCVRDAAVRALGHIGSAAASSVPEILKQLRRRSTSSFREPVAFALANMGQQAPEAVLPSVLEALQASEWYVRWVAASACGLLGEKAAAFVPWLRQLAKYDSEEKVRTVASQSLSDMSKVITLPTPNMTDWQLQLDSTSSQARADAANELGNLGKEAAEAIPKLTQLLQDDREVAGDMCVRDAAVRALGHIGSAAASSVPEILKQLRRRSTSSFREPVAFALANMGQQAPEAVLPSVLEALQASEWYVRWVAASACDMLGEKAAAFVPQLRQLAKYDSEEKVRTVASQSLSDMSKVITLPTPNMTDWQLQLDSTSSQARADAANELGKWGKQAAEAIPKLTQLLHDDREVAGDMCVRDAAVRALGHIGSAAASSVPEILKQLRRRSTSSFREPVAFALANMGQQAPEAVLPSVLEALQASEWYVRWVAASACGLLGEKAVAFVPQLRQLAKYDSEPKVRTVAEKALDSIDKAGFPALPILSKQVS
ncbi:unnamed protein product [Symbiodinium sp. CCMP2592]|nr:unnamed protein product [Symbiodinium sp. CCMP2592]